MTTQQSNHKDFARDLDNFRTVFESFPHPAIVYDQNGNFFSANPALHSIVHVDLAANPEALLRELNVRHLDDTPLGPEERAYTRALRGESVRGFQVKYSGANGELGFFEVTAMPVRSAERIVGAVVVLVDIMGRKNAERALQESEKRYRQLVEATPDIIYIYDIDTDRVAYANSQVELVLGYTAQEFLAISKMSLEHPDDIAGVKLFYSSFSEHPDTVGQSIHRIRHKDGSYRWVQVRAVPFSRNAEGRVTEVIGIIRDITGIRKNEEALKESENRLKILNENLETIVVQRTEEVRQLARELTMAEQRTRQRLSLLLHEDLQQILFSATLRIDMLAESSRDVLDALEDIGEVKRLTQKAIKTSKTLAAELNPPILKSEGLDAALKWLAQHFHNQYGLEVAATFSEPFSDIDLDIRILLVQLVRELFMNVVKHANTNRAELSVTRSDKTLRITVGDLGAGFDLEALRKLPKAPEHFGLFGIEERLRLIGGRLEIKSAPGKGTVARIVLPLREK